MVLFDVLQTVHIYRQLLTVVIVVMFSEFRTFYIHTVDLYHVQFQASNFAFKRARPF